MATLQEVKEFQKRERAKRKAGRDCTKASDALKATLRATHPAAQLAASGAKAITTFERACNRAEHTDTGEAWDLLYTLRATFNEIEAQL